MGDTRQLVVSNTMNNTIGGDLMFFLILVYIIVLSIYMKAPLLGKLLVLIINFFVPDPIPYIDEILMFFGLLRHFDDD